MNINVQPPVTMPKGIRAIIYDLDDCLAPGSNDDIRAEWLGYFSSTFHLTPEDTLRLNNEYFREIGCSATGFARAHGIVQEQDFVNSVYANNAPATSQRFINRHKQVDPRLPAAMASLQALGIQQALITQGHHNHANPMIKHLGIAEFLPHHLRWDRVAMPFSKKEPTPWRRALYVLDVQPHEVLILEDTPHNIDWPHKLGMHTALIGKRERTESVHYHFPLARDPLELLVAQYA